MTIQNNDGEKRRRPKRPRTYALNNRIGEQARDNLDSLQETLGLSQRAVLERALHRMRRCVDAEAAGKAIIMRSPDGTEEIVVGD